MVAEMMAPARDSTPAPLRTEFPFVLPRGYVDDGGAVHREGVMRLATYTSRLFPAFSLPRAAAKSNHMYASILSCGTPRPLKYMSARLN